MYQSYSFQRSGRPRWTLLATALLLVGTLCLAAWLIRYKAGLYDAPLSPEVVTLAGPIHMSVPQGWTLIPEERWPTGVVGAWTEPADVKGGARQLYVLFGLCSPRAMPSVFGGEAILELASELAGNMELAPKLMDNDPLGDWPAITYQVLFARTGSKKPDDVQTLLACAGVTPNGQVIVVALVGPRNMTSGDRRLVRKLGQSMQLPTSLSDDVDGVMKAAGIEIELPSAVRAVRDAAPTDRRVLLMSEPDEAAWFMDVYRTPLMPGRSCPKLVEDFVFSMTGTIEHASGAEVQLQNGRQVARARLPRTGRLDTTVEAVFCAKIDDQTALWLFGRAELLAEDRMEALANEIVSQAKVRSCSEMNLAGAQNAAGQWLGKLAEQGLGVHWRNWRDQQLVYMTYLPGRELARETQLLQSIRQQDATWWEWQSRCLLFGSVARQKITTQEDWRIRDDGRAFTLRRVQRGSDDYVYDEKSSADGTIERKLLIRSGGYRELTAQSDSTFACEPVLLQSLADAAVENRKELAIFRTTDTFTPEPVYWLAEPMGQTPLPGEPGGDTAFAVRIQFDYDPQPITLYYDDSRMLVAVGYDDGHWKSLLR